METVWNERKTTVIQQRQTQGSACVNADGYATHSASVRKPLHKALRQRLFNIPVDRCTA